VEDFDAMYPEFHDNPKNVRFALSTDGMNPFGHRTSTHNTWPIILSIYSLSIYSLSTWLRQKRKYLLLAILISGPKAPGTDIDIFLEPLMQEMETLRKHGVKMWDELVQSTFTLLVFINVSVVLTT
jgi:hypothetical protein